MAKKAACFIGGCMHASSVPPACFLWGAHTCFQYSISMRCPQHVCPLCRYCLSCCLQLIARPVDTRTWHLQKKRASLFHKTGIAESGRSVGLILSQIIQNCMWAFSHRRLSKHVGFISCQAAYIRPASRVHLRDRDAVLLWRCC